MRMIPVLLTIAACASPTDQVDSPGAISQIDDDVPASYEEDPDGGEEKGGANGDQNGDEEVCEIDESYAPEIDPARFVLDVDNPLFPLVPGASFVYLGPDDERVEVTVTDERKTILGVSTIVVHSVEYVEDEIVEDTFDWFAQDADGTVWYFGEDTRELEGGEVVSTEGSWEAGVDGAQPGIIMPAAPEVGLRYRQEYYACVAEDMGEVVATCQHVEVPAGAFSGCLQTLDTTPLEPDVAEHKYYCPGIGLALTVDLQTGAREELVEIEEGGTACP